MPEPDPQPADRYLNQLRQWRNWPDRDFSLGFLKQKFEREVARPHRELGNLAGLWNDHVPPEIARRTRLVGLSRGTLKVAVDSSAVLYELDRLLRGGLEKKLVKQSTGGGLRRVKLQVKPTEPADEA